jgi:hypothetical protein
MANIRDHYENAKLDKTISDLLVADKHCYISGSIVVQKGTPEWAECMAQRRKKLLEFRSLEEADVFLAKLESTLERDYVDTGLQAINYFAVLGSDHKTVPKRVILDKKSGLAAEITVERKNVDVFRADVENIMFDWGLHARKLAAYNKGRFSYDGMLRDALSEFEQKGYRFNLWNTKWSAGHLENGERSKTLELMKITPIEGVSLDEVLSHEWREQNET